MHVNNNMQRTYEVKNMSKVISYNLPGYGFANCFLFGEAIFLMDLLENYS